MMVNGEPQEEISVKFEYEVDASGKVNQTQIDMDVRTPIWSRKTLPGRAAVQRLPGHLTAPAPPHPKKPGRRRRALALPGFVLAQAKAPLVGPLAPNPAEFKQAMEQFTGRPGPRPMGCSWTCRCWPTTPAPCRSRSR
jgi:hypothetical protein